MPNWMSPRSASTHSPLQSRVYLPLTIQSVSRGWFTGALTQSNTTPAASLRSAADATWTPALSGAAGPGGPTGPDAPSGPGGPCSPTQATARSVINNVSRLLIAKVGGSHFNFAVITLISVASLLNSVFKASLRQELLAPRFSRLWLGVNGMSRNLASD